MPLARVRFTVRRMMVAIGLVAVLLGTSLWGVRLAARRAKELRLARWCGGEESMAREMAAHHQPESEDHRKYADDRRARALDAVEPDLRGIRERAAADADTRARYWAGRGEEDRERAENLAALRREHERAARYPWISVSPDPPEFVGPDYPE